MANAKQNPIEQFNALKDQLVNELADVEIEMDNLEQVFLEKMDGLKSSRDELRAALFNEVKVVKNTTLAPVLEGEGMMSPSEQLQITLKEYPGASKQDLRNLLPALSEDELTSAIGRCRKAGLIKNHGTKTQPAWFVI